jgi:hypothetical protein
LTNSQDRHRKENALASLQRLINLLHQLFFLLPTVGMPLGSVTAFRDQDIRI